MTRLRGCRDARFPVCVADDVGDGKVGRLAYLEMRILLTMVVWNFELMKCPPELSSYKVYTGITQKPVQCYVRLRRLQQN